MKHALIFLLLSTFFLYLQGKESKDEYEHFFINIAYSFPNAKQNFNTVFGLEATIGYQATPFLAFTASAYTEFHASNTLEEFEFNGDQDDPNNFADFLINSDTERSTAWFFSVELNNFIYLNRLDPYLGIGIGKQDIVTESSTLVIEESDISLFQFYIGTRFRINQSISIYAEFRRLYRDAFITSNSSNNISSTQNNISLGLHLKL